MINIAALFVYEDGPYSRIPGVVPFGIQRNAFTYDGPHPVVAHPPCARWGRYWYGRPGGQRLVKGDEGGMFAFALSAVRTWGGVLEHPKDSFAWKAFDLTSPPPTGGWIEADTYGWTCNVEQGHYGHPARKATWLYYVGDKPPPDLIWGPSTVALRPSNSPRRGMVERLSKRQRGLTPPLFARALVSMARLARDYA